MNSAETLTTYSKDVFSIVAELSTFSFVAIFFVILLLVAALRFGKEQVIAFHVALYLGYLLYTTFPYVEKVQSLGDIPDWWVSIGVFTAFSLGAFLVVRRVIFADYSFSGGTGWLDAVLLAFSGTLLLVAMVYALFPLSSTPLLTPILTTWLSSASLFFWWLAAPIVVIFFASRR